MNAHNSSISTLDSQAHDTCWRRFPDLFHLTSGSSAGDSDCCKAKEWGLMVQIGELAICVIYSVPMVALGKVLKPWSIEATFVEHQICGQGLDDNKS